MARLLLWVFLAGAAADDGVVTFDPASTLRVSFLETSAVVNISTPACLLAPCNGSWTLPVTPATVSVDGSLFTVTVTGPARTLSVITGAVTDSWWQIFVDLADVNATGASETFAARVDGAALVEAPSQNMSTLGSGTFTVDPANSNGGYIDAGVDLMLDDAVATRSKVCVPDVENWVDYAYVRAAADVAGTRATFAGLVRVPAPAARR